MSLQDALLTAGALFFIVALVRMVVAEDKPPVFSSATTGFWLAVFACVYLTEHFWFAAVTTAITAALWLVVAAQKVLR